MSQKKNTKARDFLWFFLVLFLVAGWFYPLVGFAAIICMMAPILWGFWKGCRGWCGSYCPRGSFLSKLLNLFSWQGTLPVWLKSKGMRNFILVFLLGIFAIGLVATGGDLVGMGLVIYRMVLITTVVGIFLGLIYQPRTWCKICPMGTLAHYAAKSQRKC